MSDTEITEPEVTGTDLFRVFVLSPTVTLFALWMIWISLSFVGLVGSVDDTSLGECLHDSGACAQVVVDDDCSWVPLTRCTVWIPLDGR